MTQEGTPINYTIHITKKPSLHSPQQLDTIIEQIEIRVELRMLPRTLDLVINQRGKHLRLQELRQERSVVLWLIGQIRGLVKVLQGLSIRQPLLLVLIGVDHKVLVRIEHVHEAVQEQFPHRIVEPQIVLVLLLGCLWRATYLIRHHIPRQIHFIEIDTRLPDDPHHLLHRI